MKRRIIRSVFILLLLLCVGGWGWSYVYSVVIRYRSPDNEYVVECDWGQIRLQKWKSFTELLSSVDSPALKSDLHVETFKAQSPPSGEAAILDRMNNGHYFIGFDIWNKETVKMLALPFWFPAAISAALLLLVWRKTRPKTQGRAFPVEMEKPIGEHGGKAE